MTATSHRVGAFAASTTVLYFGGFKLPESIPIAVCYVVGALAGSLFPDADMPYSRIGRRYLIVLWPLYLIQFMIHLFAPRSFMDKTLRHRGIMHSPMIWGGLFLMLFYWMKSLRMDIIFWLCKGVMIGVMSHLLLDFISGGIPLLGPFYPKKIAPVIHIRTGGFMEQVTCLMMFLYSAFMTFQCII